MAEHGWASGTHHPSGGVEDLKTKDHVEAFVRQRLDLPANLKAKVAHFSGDITALQDRATALETRAGNLEGRATSLEGRTTATEGDIAALTTRMTAAEDYAAGLDTRIAALETVPPQVFVYRTTDFTVPKGVLTAIPFGSERRDLPLDDQHSNTTNNTRLTSRYTRLCLIVGTGEWEPIAAAGGVRRQLQILRTNAGGGGTSILAVDEVPPAIDATSELSRIVVAIAELTPNDYVELCAFHDHPTLDLKIVYKADYSPWFSMTAIAKTS